MSPLRRIAVCITELHPGGAEQALVELVTRLDRTAWEPHVYCLAGAGPLVEPLVAAEIPVTCLGAAHIGRLDVVCRLARHWRRLRPHVVQTFLLHANLVGRCAAWCAGVRVVVSGVRVAEERGGWRLWLDRWTEGLVTRHVCVSQAVADFCRERAGLSPHKLVVIPNGVDVARFAAAVPIAWDELGLPPGPSPLLAIGRLDPQKGFDLLIAAVGRIAAELPDLRLVIVGDGDRRQALAAQIVQAGLQQRVFLVGRRTDVPRLLRGSSGFILSSRWEGLPNVVLEALAAGTPVVATCVAGVPEMIEDGVTGRLVAPNDVDQLATAIRELWTAPGSAQARARVGQQRVAAGWSWDTMAERYAALYRELLAASEAAGRGA